jgi:hypothetical protein
MAMIAPAKTTKLDMITNVSVSGISRTATETGLYNSKKQNFAPSCRAQPPLGPSALAGLTGRHNQVPSRSSEFRQWPN